MIDYLDKGNRINFEYSLKWAQVGMNVQHQIKEYNLMNLLMKVYKLFVQMPPLSMAELFGAEEGKAQDPQNDGQWEEIPPELLKKKSTLLEN